MYGAVHVQDSAGHQQGGATGGRAGAVACRSGEAAAGSQQRVGIGDAGRQVAEQLLAQRSADGRGVAWLWHFAEVATKVALVEYVVKEWLAVEMCPQAYSGTAGLQIGLHRDEE